MKKTVLFVAALVSCTRIPVSPPNLPVATVRTVAPASVKPAAPTLAFTAPEKPVAAVNPSDSSLTKKHIVPTAAEMKTPQRKTPIRGRCSRLISINHLGPGEPVIRPLILVTPYLDFYIKYLESPEHLNADVVVLTDEEFQRFKDNNDKYYIADFDNSALYWRGTFSVAIQDTCEIVRTHVYDISFADRMLAFAFSTAETFNPATKKKLQTYLQNRTDMKLDQKQ